MGLKYYAKPPFLNKNLKNIYNNLQINNKKFIKQIFTIKRK